MYFQVADEDVIIEREGGELALQLGVDAKGRAGARIQSYEYDSEGSIVILNAHELESFGEKCISAAKQLRVVDGIED